MKINWKLRFKNKATLAALLACTVAFVYQILGIFGVTAPVTEDQATQVIGVLINILVGAGVLVDPTTQGAADSDRALTYNRPR